VCSYSKGLPQRPTGPALARTFRISDLPWADSGFHAAPTSVGCPLLRPCSAQETPSATNRVVIYLYPIPRAQGACLELLVRRKEKMT